MVYRREGRHVWFVAVPTVNGGRVKRSTGTLHRATALAMERMIEVLGPRGRREWDLLALLVGNRLSVAELYDAYGANDLAGLRQRLDDVDLGAHVAGWRAWAVDRVGATSVDRYEAHLRTLVADGVPYPRSRFTAPEIARWLGARHALTQKRRPTARTAERRQKEDERGAKEPTPKVPRPIGSATRRKYLAAVSSFGKYLKEIGVVERNPARDVDAPPPSRPRVVEIALADVMRIVEHARPPYRALFALLYGSGIEVSTALRLTESDVDAPRREVRARGTKTHSRDRIVRIAEWAWPHFVKHLNTLTPGARLFRLDTESIDRWDVGTVHRETLRALELPHHRVHDARHFYAIRAVRVGTPYELVARQLGHVDVAMVAKVYGRFAPRSDERDRWERIAAEQDARELTSRNTNRGAMGTVLGTSAQGTKNTEAANPLEGSGFVDSRGGTRTHDPGIMSAVL